MSIPTDDLILSLTTSFKSNHIGQEQHDLVALQKHLNQTLHSSNRPLHQNQQGQPPNTPTQSTGAWNWAANNPNGAQKARAQNRLARSRAQSISTNAEDSQEMMLIDEEEVEELLNMHSPAQPNPPQTLPQLQSNFSNSQQSWAPATPVSPTTYASSSDPFFAATMNSQNNHSNVQPVHPNAFFAPQTAFLSQPQQQPFQAYR